MSQKYQVYLENLMVQIKEIQFLIKQYDSQSKLQNVDRQSKGISDPLLKKD
jgi:hypothetical protein